MVQKRNKYKGRFWPKKKKKEGLCTITPLTLSVEKPRVKGRVNKDFGENIADFKKVGLPHTNACPFFFFFFLYYFF